MGLPAASPSMATWMAGEWSGAAPKALSDLETTSTTSIMSTAWTQEGDDFYYTDRSRKRIVRKLAKLQGLSESHRLTAISPRPGNRLGYKFPKQGMRIVQTYRALASQRRRHGVQDRGSWGHPCGQRFERP
ncbi:hypothetical protein AU210_012991 [Fusarium oxysporum f. sp. radicis-cucumerinum]|uniref:Uncharacterized protein n=1 Tax=Fusarium oxysporum f. sp. radicis-cucumerinum TaxID=327505 RepID=A0A2H3GNY2_FUSOX|nr:hypothetical protein AU210_012991 [Fusarium oxysporum f. sp. radicis-cucumerinum]